MTSCHYVCPNVKVPFTVLLRITDRSVWFVAVVAKACFVFALSMGGGLRSLYLNRLQVRQLDIQFEVYDNLVKMCSCSLFIHPKQGFF